MGLDNKGHSGNRGPALHMHVVMAVFVVGVRTLMMT